MDKGLPQRFPGVYNIYEHINALTMIRTKTFDNKSSFIPIPLNSIYSLRKKKKNVCALYIKFMEGRKGDKLKLLYNHIIRTLLIQLE